MSRARLVSLGVLLLVAVLFAVGGAWYVASRKSSRQPVAQEASPKSFPSPSAVAQAPTAATSPNSVVATPAGQAPTASLAPGWSAGDIEFIPPEKLAAINFSDKTADSETDTSYDFYRVGRFVRGPNLGADFLEASVSQFALPCKGDCGDTAIVRYIEKDKLIFPLPRISDPEAPGETVGRGTAVDARPFAALHATFGQTVDSSIPLLEYPQTIAAGSGTVLERAREGEGVLNPGVLQLAFHHPVYGDVWMTKPGLGPQKAFYEECKDVNPKAEGSEGSCQGLPAYTDNAFYFFRPDGTYLPFVYKPDFHAEDPRSVTWNGGPLPAGTAYVDHSVAGCSWAGADAVSVVSPATVSDRDLEPVGKVNATGDPLYGLKDKNHRLYKEFYAAYDSSFPKWASRLQNEQSGREFSYDEFVTARPLFLWKDPFGRLIRFVNSRFVVPNACEPVLYLYPPEKENIQVKLGNDVIVLKSYPAYQDGWSVVAEPDGKLMDLSSGRSSPYLFWEGHSYVLPQGQSGYVVSSGDIPAFLEAILPRLGLNQKEIGDFMAAWPSRLTVAPYYFITFLDKSVIDAYFPLRIEPPPSTTIRVFMDFAPLSQPVVVQPPSLAPTPQRQGFTVVEWGVLVR